MADLLSILGLGLETINKIHNFVKAKITIEPKSFISFPGNWNIIIPIIVTNRTENPLFDVQIILWSKGKSPRIEIRIDDQEIEHSESIDDSIDVNTDSFVIKGVVNEKSFILIQLSYLQPNSSKRLFIKPIGALETKLEVVKFSTHPSLLASKENGVSIPFTPPFDMSVISISLLLKRKI